MASPWETELGTTQGRIAASGAPEGEYVYELGHALLGKRQLAVGDYHEVKQSVVLDDAAKLARATVRFVAPPTIPAGHGWLFTMRLNGSVVASRQIRRGARTIEVSDLAIPLFAATGPPGSDELAFRLEVTT